MFKPGKLYKHRSSRDLHYFVAGEVDQEGNYVTFPVKYWNHFYKIFQGNTENITINKRDFKNWSEVPEELK